LKLLGAIAHDEQEVQFRGLGKGLHRGGRPFLSLSDDYRHMLLREEFGELLLLAFVQVYWLREGMVSRSMTKRRR